MTWLLGFGYALAGALALAAGALRLARARLTGEASASWRAATLLVAAAGLVLAGSASGIAGSAPGTFPAPLYRLVLLSPLAVVLLAGSRPHLARRAPGRPVVLAALGSQVALAVMLAALPAASWLGRPRVLWLALDTAAVLAAVAVSGLALAAAAAGVREAHAAHSEKLLRMADDLDAARNTIALLEEQQRERLHEARTAMLGVLGATQLFAVPSAQAGDSTERLQQLVTAEARRLATLLDPESDEPLREFGLASVFEPVLTAYRATGMSIDVDLRGLRAYGRPTATATVLANLLSNAAKYAASSPVTVRAASAGPSVRICVEDCGGGIPADARRLVLGRGERLSRAAAPGFGIGLYSSAQAMAEQGGSLRIEGRGGLDGTCIILSLPAAASRPIGPLRANAS